MPARPRATASLSICMRLRGAAALASQKRRPPTNHSLPATKPSYSNDNNRYFPGSKSASLYTRFLYIFFCFFIKTFLYSSRAICIFGTRLRRGNLISQKPPASVDDLKPGYVIPRAITKCRISVVSIRCLRKKKNSRLVFHEKNNSKFTIEITPDNTSRV